MIKFLKWVGIILGALILIAIIGFQVMKHNTKKHSPEETYTYTENGFDVTINYSRPFKKGRAIFGELVAYDKVWRTGANEPTSFETTTPLIIDGQELPAGSYTLWTIPSAGPWQIIFNNGDYGWGVNWKQEASRDPALDVVNVSSKPQKTFKVYEQFTIEIEGDPERLILSWDDIQVPVPIAKK